MSDFSAKILAQLDTSKIPSQVKGIEKSTKITLSKITLDTKSLPSQIQASLDGHKFKISLDGIKMTNIDSQVKSAANRAGQSFSQTLVNRINSQMSAGGIEASIAKVTAQYEKLGATGHSKLSEIKSDLEKLNRLQSSLTNASATGNSKAMISDYQKFSETLAKVKNNLATVSAESKTFVSNLQLKTLDNQIQSWMDKNSRATKSFGNTLQGLRGRLSELISSGNATESELKDIENAFNKVKQAAIASGQTGSTFASTLKGAFSSITRYVSVSTVIYQVVNGLKEMCSNVVAIDTAMTELIKVTDETDAAYSKFLKNAGASAKQIGSTVTGLINSTADFARLGYSFTDSQELAKVANIYAVVGDEIESVDDATSSLISTMAAFNVQASNAMSIVDKFNEIGNRFAISSGGIGDALTRSASSLAAANNTLDQSIALITAANTVVQDPDAVGTAFKTISMRIRGATTELEEAGLETEGMAESTAELRREILALSGVDIMLDKNTFKSTYDILDELAQKWENLTDIQQASITELIAGKRQGNIVSSLMNNFDIARDALEVSQTSSGSATREHEKYMESLEAKINQLKAAWEDFSQVFMDDGFLKGFVDAGTGILSVLTDIIDTLGVIPTLVAAVVAVLSFKKVGVFAPLEAEAVRSATVIKTVFTNVKGYVSSIFQKKDGVSFGSVFDDSLVADKKALLAYIAEINKGASETDAFAHTMKNASSSAQELAKSGNVNTESIADFTKHQKMSQLQSLAQSTSLKNIRMMMNDYNYSLEEGSNGLTKCGLKQNEFTEAVSKSNASFGAYLKNLDGAKASMRGYLKVVGKSVVDTVAFSIVIANTMKALSDIISWAFNSDDKAESLADKFDSISSELSDVNSELSSLESELSSVEGQIDELLKKDELSFTDKEELARLKNVSAELKHQIKLTETLQESLKKSLSETAIGSYNDYAQNTSFYSTQSKAERKEEAQSMGTSIGNAAGLVIGGIIGTLAGGNTMLGMAIGSTVGSIGGGLIGGAISDASYDSELTVAEMLDNMRRERAKLESAQEEAYKTYTDHRSNGNKEDWEAATQALNDYNTALATHINQLSSYYNAIDYASLTTDAQREEYLKMGDDLDSYNIQMGVSGAKTVAFDRIFSDELITDEAKELKQAVEAALNSGEDIRFYDFDADQFTKMKSRLADMGLTLTDVISYFKELEEATEAATDYETYDMVESIAALSTGVGQLVDAFKEFNEEGVLTAETLVKLNALFGGLGDEWTNYVDVMTSTGSTTAEAVEATQKLAEEHLNQLLENGGIKLNRYNSETGQYEFDADKYATYLSTINELELIGVENAKEYLDALQQQAMLQETVKQMRADAAEEETLLAKEALNATEQERLALLQSKTIDDYIRATEDMYGLKMEDTSLLQKQYDFEEYSELAKEFDKYLSDMDGSLDEYESSIQRHNDIVGDYNAVWEKIDALREQGYNVGLGEGTTWAEVGSALAEGFTFTLADTKYDEYDRLVEDLDAYEDLLDEEAEIRQEYFDNMISIAEKAGIDLSDISIDEFDPYTYGSGSVFNQVYDRVKSELENVNFDELANGLETEINAELDGLGLEVDLDLNIDGIVLDELESAYSLLDTAQAEMDAGTGLSVNTIQALAAAEENYLDYLYKENGLIKLNTEAWKERANQKANENLDVLRTEIDDLESKRNEALYDELRAIKDGDTAAAEEYHAAYEEYGSVLDEKRRQLDILETIFESYNDVVNDELDNTNALLSSITAAKEILSAQSTGKSISVAEYNSAELKEYTSALEYHNGVLQLNAEKVNEIIEAKAEEQIAINDTNKAIKQSQYLANVAEIEKLRRELNYLSEDEVEARSEVEASINALLDENEVLRDSCTQFDLMSASLREATSAYQHWLNAQNAAQSGDMFDDTINAFNHVFDTLNDKDSELFGRIGRTDYEAAIGLIIPESVDAEDTEKVNAYLDSIYELFTYDDDGNYAGLNIANFCEQATEQGLMVLDEATGSYKIVGEKTMADFAEGMNLSLPLVQAMFGEMEEFGGEFSWADEANKTIGDLAISADVAAQKLRELNSGLIIELDVSHLETVDEKMSALDSTISQMQELKIDADATEIEYANSIISYCVTQKQQLEEPAILNVDVSKLSESAAEAVSLMQEFKTAYNNLELKKSLGLDTTDAQAEVDSLLEQISSSENDYLVSLALDSTSVETLNASITSLEQPEILATFKIDETALLDYQAEDKTATVTYDIDTTAVDNYNPKNLRRYVNYYIRTFGAVEANGTAHASGTAYAGGNWGTAPGGKTLVGELGQEIVVDPHTGKWYTVGDTGAEFRNIPRGAIVFNHKQSASLLKNGYVAGRASALVGGTAMVTGGMPVQGANDSTVSGGNSTSNYQRPSNSATNSTSNTSTDDELEKLDWIEVALSRIQRAIKNLQTVATSTFKSLGTKLSATKDEISLITEEISLQQSAYQRYMQEAESVGLSSDLATLVQNGAIDISQYDKDTQELIKEYQEWYEKALACSDAIIELKENLASLYEDNFNNAKDDYDNQLSLFDHLSNTYNNGIDELKAKSYLESTEYYAALQNVERQRAAILSAELAALEQSFSEAMASGEIEKYSDSWYEMQGNINDTKEELQEANTALAEYSQTMREIEWGYFDYIQERISQLTKESDFLIELMSNSDLYTDNGQLTESGTATMGLHGMNFNTYMAQADQYAAEILEIDKQLADDPYNTQLIERREELLGLQQDSILAAEAEKQAIVDMVREGIELELDALQELIDKYTDALDSAKNLYDYQKKIRDHTSDISTLQKQLSAYENDLSEETQAKVQKLQVELKEAEENLEETEYQQYISDQKKLLDELYLEYETVLNQRLGNVDVLIEEMIGTVNANTDSINATLTQVADSVGYTMTDNMQAIWNGSTEALDGTLSVYGDGFNEQLTAINNVLNSIQANTAAMIASSDDQAQEDIDDTSSTTEPDPNVTVPTAPQEPETTPQEPAPQENSITVGGKINAKGAKIYSYAGDTSGENQYFASDPIYTVLDENKGYLKVRWHKLSSGVTGWFKKGDVKAYKTGGLVDYTGLAQLDGTPSKPELVLNAQDTENFMSLRDALRQMAAQELTMSRGKSNFGGVSPVKHTSIIDNSQAIKRMSGENPASNIQQSTGDVNFNIAIDRVQDYNDFVRQMQHDPQFDKMLQAMTVDRLVGGSSLKKYKFNFNNR